MNEAQVNIAVLDACVLYPPALRDLFMWLAVAGVYGPCWADIIHDEWMRNVLKDYPTTSTQQLERTRQLMDNINPHCLVTGHEALIPTLQLPDPDDCHVLAAAIHCHAQHIVTFNLSDFPLRLLSPLGVKAVHPDPFLSVLFDSDRATFLDGVRSHRASLRNPPKSVNDYIDAFVPYRMRELIRRLHACHDEI